MSAPARAAARQTTESALSTMAVLEREITHVIVGQPLLVRRLLTALFAAIPYSYTRSETRTGCGVEGI